MMYKWIIYIKYLKLKLLYILIGHRYGGYNNKNKNNNNRRQNRNQYQQSSLNQSSTQSLEVNLNF